MNMKKFITIGIVSVAAICFGIIISNNSFMEGAYHQRTSLLVPNSTANAYLEELYMMKGDFRHEDFLRALEETKAMPKNRATLSWIDQGPDNIGGRTRAIVVDRSDINHVWAGGVSGGLFESNSRASTWQKVETFNDNLAVSSMCQTPDGTLWVATGHQREAVGGYEDSGLGGNGLYMQESDGSFTQIAGTSAFSYINEVRCDTLNNWVWLATNQGLKRYTPATSTLEDISGGLPGGSCNSLSMSQDGELLVCSMSGNKTYVSQNYGVDFVNYSDAANTANPLAENSASRIEYAVSFEKYSGKYQVYASCASSFLKGIWRSTDNGVNWTEIAPAYDGVTPGSFSPFSSGGSGQGTYDNIITCVPGNGNRILLGGIDIYSWSTTGNWTQVSQWFLGITSTKFVHADQHEMTWDKNGRLYMGNDGGVFFSENAGTAYEPEFYSANRGYNVTQYYSTSFSAHGDVIGGAQDNGTSANYHDNSTWREFDKVGGGDGFGAEMSFINRNVLFGSVYYSSVFRSNDRGSNTSSFVPVQLEDENSCVAGSTGGDGCGQFNTHVALWEDPDDELSEDTVSYIPSQAYSAGDTILVPSETSQMEIKYITPSDVVFDDTLDFDPAETTFDTIIVTAAPSIEYNMDVVNYTVVYGAPAIDPGDSVYLVDLDTTVFVADTMHKYHYWGTNPLRPGKIVDMGNEPQTYNIAWDTLKVQDRYQSWFALGIGGSMGIYMTRNALRFSSDQDWVKAIDEPSMGAVTIMEFSKSGNIFWIGTSNGQLWKLEGFNDVYSPEPVYPIVARDSLLDWDRGHYATTLTQISTSFAGAPILGIATGGNGVSPDDDHVVVVTGGSGRKVYESTNGSGASPTFTNITSDLPSQPFYSCVIERDDANTIIVGGELGVYITENGGSSWENANGDFGYVPVFDMGQNWRNYDEGCLKPGSIYIGTHGRGIWSTDEYLGMPEQGDNLDKAKFIPNNINIYPNPMTDNGTIAFDLDNNSDVLIHIFNLSGQLVRTINHQGMMAGSNVITFGVADLQSGAYIVRLKAGDQVETAKFIKY